MTSYTTQPLAGASAREPWDPLTSSGVTVEFVRLTEDIVRQDNDISGDS